MERWVGRVAFVTGASAGIGAVVAEYLVKRGMIVVGFARRAEKIEELSKRLSKYKGKLHAIKGDLQNEEDIKAAFAWVEEHLKSPVHVLVNNAGYILMDTLLDGNAENWRKVFDINVIGLSICTKEAIKSMRAHGFDEGHIININSVAGRIVPSFAIGMYSATKYSVTALTEALRKQLLANKSKIRVTSVFGSIFVGARCLLVYGGIQIDTTESALRNKYSISPGAVRTEIAENTSVPGISIDEIPMLLPSDIADAVVFVLSLRQQVHVPELTIIQDGEIDYTPIEKMFGNLQ